MTCGGQENSPTIPAKELKERLAKVGITLPQGELLQLLSMMGVTPDGKFGK